MTTIVDGTTGITFPSTISGVSATQQYSGRVLQTQTSVLTTTASNSGAAYADTGLTVTITPTSSSSKFLIQWSIHNGQTVATASNGFNLVRNGTNIAQGTGGTYNITSESGNGGSAHGTVNSFVYLDSPATTSAITYKVQWKAQTSCTGYLNRTTELNAGSDNYQSGMISTFVVTEIAG